MLLSGSVLPEASSVSWAPAGDVHSNVWFRPAFASGGWFRRTPSSATSTVTARSSLFSPLRVPLSELPLRRQVLFCQFTARANGWALLATSTIACDDPELRPRAELTAVTSPR